ncbi:hypothetical protein O6H91_06G101700 [Diphasiastrum complanatum]|uniref:Uncharacterized protein n=13 Tax=Diphasiastrum complanatum TaxID=34168 RepID=A0ACC2DD99_DIPCM|nr:hypothetical protein O6H91_06G041800 [Diphasiastrum complanatum]KAJ7552096.1 hypothetical protein O6H91_06G041800 [Diphasiastrum complanatum]KAJ7552097.1 hypothetical protein O6H91_06G041800 [Diphasiastrum complanatum]KAJ7552098.1 hypothetical protein O6H91_06G041800 [Diphasiastrum complanatum]KAJ7552099.1 hypothetical protein O6H91_06G041800 [Diphasiastrum complanatum]
MALSFRNLLDFPHSVELSWNTDCKNALHLQRNFRPATPYKRRNSILRSAERKNVTISAIDSTKSASGDLELPAVVVLKAEVVIKKKSSPSLGQIIFGGADPLVAVDNMISSGVDTFSDTFCQRIYIQLISTDIDLDTGLGERNQESAFGNWLQKASVSADRVKYVTQLIVNENFGKPGAIVVVNKHQSEFFLESVTVEGLKSGSVYFPCYSWVQPLKDGALKRVFFSNEVYLPSATPKGLLDLRRSELKALQGEGKGIREAHERIYDYDVYNDLGNPDKGKDLKRATVGGSKERPYPRRCRTGRPPSKTDSLAESRLPSARQKVYVPRDEDFEQIKAGSFVPGKIKGIVHALVPALIDHFKESVNNFLSFDEIDKLYYEGIHLKTPGKLIERTIFWDKLYLSQLVKRLKESGSDIIHLIQYPLPEILHRDKFVWMRDFEFGRQFLAGVSPSKIERLKVFPPVSQVDQRPSSFKAEHITPQLGGLSIEEAIEEGKLFIVDYYDVFMPFIDKINALEGHKTYASRTILLHASGIMRPIAIELSLPASISESVSSSTVLTPAEDATGIWLWQLAKAHVSSNHMGYHQLVTHWLQTHACTEPYVIATHRQLSVLHPVARLLQPHLRYTMEINAVARQNLISADGIIEKCFTPGKYAVEMSSAAYGRMWQFNTESLPKDLLRRGMALEDQSDPSGVRLVIEDYPYAADGLLIWTAIKSWVKDYLSIYYTHPDAINNDSELQQWWTEIRTKGHADKAEEPWWPKLRNVDDLTEILTIMIWVVSGQHAAVNFGQFLHAGYIPYLPCLTRQHIPNENDPEFNHFVHDPQRFYLATIPSKLQATTVMAVLETLSTHSQDEEYLGHRGDAAWICDKNVKEASDKFLAQLQAIETTINERNKNPKLKNRYGAGVHPYQLLLPRSGPGVTSRGIPNSVSI